MASSIMVKVCTLRSTPQEHKQGSVNIAGLLPVSRKCACTSQLVNPVPISSEILLELKPMLSNLLYSEQLFIDSYQTKNSIKKIGIMQETNLLELPRNR